MNTTMVVYVLPLAALLTLILRVTMARRRVKLDKDAWHETYADMARENVIALEVTVFQEHGVMRTIYESRPADEKSITLAEVDLVARNIMKFPRAIRVSVCRLVEGASILDSAINGSR
jgi:hypothetical protein